VFTVQIDQLVDASASVEADHGCMDALVPQVDSDDGSTGRDQGYRGFASIGSFADVDDTVGAQRFDDIVYRGFGKPRAAGNVRLRAGAIATEYLNDSVLIGATQCVL
jgi:hypothetical protein